MSKGSSSSNHVCGTNPYSTGNTTDEGITLSSTKASHFMSYSYLSRVPLATSMTMFKSSGGLSPVGMPLQKFICLSTFFKAEAVNDLNFRRFFHNFDGVSD